MQTYPSICIFFTTIVVLACAQEVPPPGGPPDTFSPLVISTIPTTETTDVPVTVSPVILFNERMEPRSIQESIFISPIIPFKIKTNWGGNEIKLEFEEPLIDNQTYIITIGTSARDLGGNRLTESEVLAISTGLTIDSGEISGTVTSGGKKVVGAFVWAYNLRTLTDPDPTAVPPDYIVQTGQNGQFDYSNLAAGTYRLFAFLDQGRDQRYNVGQDPFGVPTSDIILTNETLQVRNRRLELAVRDTSTLVLLSARPDDVSHLKLRFTNSVNAEDLSNPNHYRILNISDNTRLNTLTAYRDPLDSASVVLITQPQSGLAEYEVTVSGLFDKTGRPMDQADATVAFSGIEVPDTSPPELLQSMPADSAINRPLQLVVSLMFSEGIRADSSAMRLMGTGNQIVQGIWQWNNSATAQFTPASALEADTEYHMLLFTSRIQDWTGNLMHTQADTTDTLLIRFRTVDPLIFGQVSGNISDLDSTARGAISVKMTDLDNPRSIYETFMPSPGDYRFGEVLPGSYSLSAYRDADRNGALSLGRAVPFIAAERITARADTILVRSGWESEQINLQFQP